jgi:hypothetical protein
LTYPLVSNMALPQIEHRPFLNAQPDMRLDGD